MLPRGLGQRESVWWDILVPQPCWVCTEFTSKSRRKEVPTQSHVRPLFTVQNLPSPCTSGPCSSVFLRPWETQPWERGGCPRWNIGCHLGISHCHPETHYKRLGASFAQDILPPNTQPQGCKAPDLPPGLTFQPGAWAADGSTCLLEEGANL